MGINRKGIRDELCHLIEVDRSTSAKTISAIFTTMRTALRRGESVYIEGIGKFTLRSRGPLGRKYNIFYNTGKPKRQVRGKTVYKIFPPKKYIHFEPAKDLLRALNEQP